MTTYISKGARLSPDGKYRYSLWREWRDPAAHDDANWRWLGKDGAGQLMGDPKSCMFVMLNPSTADGEKDDPTIRRCVGFCKSFKYERLVVVNLFAYRTRSPSILKALTHADDPVGWQNSEVVKEQAAEAGMIILAWGAHGGHLGQDETMLGWLSGYEDKLRLLTRRSTAGRSIRSICTARAGRSGSRCCHEVHSEAAQAQRPGDG